MKKFIIFVSLFFISINIYSQNENFKYEMIKKEVDSLVKKHKITEISIVIEHGLDPIISINDFYLDKGFLIVNRKRAKSFFCIDKLVAFHLIKISKKPKYSIQFVF